jgi:hypothetical protein
MTLADIIKDNKWAVDSSQIRLRVGCDVQKWSVFTVMIVVRLQTPSRAQNSCNFHTWMPVMICLMVMDGLQPSSCSTKRHRVYRPHVVGTKVRFAPPGHALPSHDRDPFPLFNPNNMLVFLLTLTLSLYPHARAQAPRHRQMNKTYIQISLIMNI